MKIKILQGLPGSGKSTWAKEFCSKNKDWVRVNRDDLRNMRGEYWIPKQEDLITNWERFCVQEALRCGYNVIIDATHLNPKYITQWKELLQTNHEIEVKFFNVPLEECIKNDLKRPNSVGEKIIKEMYNKYMKPKIEPLKQDPKLPKAIICDLDGTLCIHNGRGPFEYDKCNTDLINEPVKKIIENYLSYGEGNIIFLSGREDSCAETSAKWIINHLQIKLDEFDLYMRKAGDMRKDCIVKHEIFENYIKNKRYIEFILDDRLQVCRMWHEIGLPLLKVGDPDADF